MLYQAVQRWEAQRLHPGDAYPCVDLWDPVVLEWLAWVVYDGMFAPGPPPEMLGHHDWDHMLAGTLVLLIYCGKMPYVHCNLTIIAGTNVQRAT